MSLRAAARTTISSLKPHRSSIEPPPRATINTSGRGIAPPFSNVLNPAIAAATSGAQAAPCLHQRLVAGAVAERVVDDLETVQVDEQQRELVPHAPCLFQRPLGAPDELAPVGELMINFRDVTRNMMAREKALYDGHPVAAVVLQQPWEVVEIK